MSEPPQKDEPQPKTKLVIDDSRIEIIPAEGTITGIGDNMARISGAPEAPALAKEIVADYQQHLDPKTAHEFAVKLCFLLSAAHRGDKHRHDMDIAKGLQLLAQRQTKRADQNKKRVDAYLGADAYLRSRGDSQPTDGRIQAVLRERFGVNVEIGVVKRLRLRLATIRALTDRSGRD